MQNKISVVINTLNEEKNIANAINSIKWADEIIVCDMHSEDETVNVARKLGAKVFFHKKEKFVEPARNFAISKASYDWILILDADEQVSESLGQRLRKISSKTQQVDYVRLPRKNIIFGHFMQASMWWPDYNIRFFKKGVVKWGNRIHRPPQADGQGLDLPEEEQYAIIHHNYDTISQFISRMNRYTSIEADELAKEGYQFNWKDLFEKPLGEFLSRYFANGGYKDGIHGLALSFLQAFSFAVVYLKLWEKTKFGKQEILLTDVENQSKKSAEAIKYWIEKSKNSKSFFKRIFKRSTI